MHSTLSVGVRNVLGCLVFRVGVRTVLRVFASGKVAQQGPKPDRLVSGREIQETDEFSNDFARFWYVVR